MKEKKLTKDIEASLKAAIGVFCAAVQGLIFDVW